MLGSLASSRPLDSTAARRKLTILAAWAAGAGLAGAGAGELASSKTPSELGLLSAGLLIAIALLAIGLWRPTALAALVFALLPLVRREPAPVDVAAAIFIFTIALTSAGRIRIPNAVVLPIAAFGSATLLSISRANDLGRAISYEWTTIYLIGLAICLSVVIGHVEWARRCIQVYIVGAAASSLAGVGALFVSFPGSSALLYDPQRTMALFKDPNVFSGFLVPPIAILFDELWEPRLLRWSTTTKLAALAALSAGLLFAFSRAAWLNAAVALAAIGAFRIVRSGSIRHVLRVVGAVAVLAAGAYGLLVVTNSTAFLQSRSHIQAYDQERFATQSEALRSSTTHVFGYGPGQVEVNLPLASHSLYARVAYEQGVPGLVTLAVLFGVTLWAAAAIAAEPAQRRFGGPALLGAWLGLLANSFFIDTLHWRHLWIVAALIWASYASLRLRAEEPGLPAVADVHSSSAIRSAATNRERRIPAT